MNLASLLQQSGSLSDTLARLRQDIPIDWIIGHSQRLGVEEDEPLDATIDGVEEDVVAVSYSRRELAAFLCKVPLSPAYMQYDSFIAELMGSQPITAPAAPLPQLAKSQETTSGISKQLSSEIKSILQLVDSSLRSNKSFAPFVVDLAHRILSSLPSSGPGEALPSLLQLRSYISAFSTEPDIPNETKRKLFAVMLNIALICKDLPSMLDTVQSILSSPNGLLTDSEVCFRISNADAASLLGGVPKDSVADLKSDFLRVASYQTPGLVIPEGSAYRIACDNTHVFLLTPAVIAKVGTGYGGTQSGSVVNMRPPPLFGDLVFYKDTLAVFFLSNSSVMASLVNSESLEFAHPQAVARISPGSSARFFTSKKGVVMAVLVGKCICFHLLNFPEFGICASTFATSTAPLIIACGRNRHGELTLGTTSSDNVGMTVSSFSKGAFGIAASNGSTYILTKAGTVLACGANGNGELGRGNCSDGQSSIEPIDFGRSITIVQIAVSHSGESALFLSAGGDVFALGFLILG